MLAPPGAGKTEVLAQRIVRLLTDSRGDSYRVLALTYNNRAAASMRKRVRDRLGEESWRATIETYRTRSISMCFDTTDSASVSPQKQRSTTPSMPGSRLLLRVLKTMGLH